eukprot:TRINITY_DN6887_c0_g1_i1.p1 TRINITY_DN6887_c0_g1~~TRINITY_DN6887_c0_g1_i1.p1  ORF type:complete len:380 (-),score=48.47 TRINITY_DN6887_c0_g1_i1:67-1185(-)
MSDTLLALLLPQLDHHVLLKKISLINTHWHTQLLPNSPLWSTLTLDLYPSLSQSILDSFRRSIKRVYYPELTERDLYLFYIQRDFFHFDAQVIIKNLVDVYSVCLNWDEFIEMEDFDDCVEFVEYLYRLLELYFQSGMRDEYFIQIFDNCCIFLSKCFETNVVRIGNMKGIEKHFSQNRDRDENVEFQNCKVALRSLYELHLVNNLRLPQMYRAYMKSGVPINNDILSMMHSVIYESRDFVTKGDLEVEITGIFIHAQRVFEFYFHGSLKPSHMVLELFCEDSDACVIEWIGERIPGGLPENYNTNFMSALKNAHIFIDLDENTSLLQLALFLSCCACSNRFIRKYNQAIQRLFTSSKYALLNIEPLRCKAH